MRKTALRNDLAFCLAQKASSPPEPGFERQLRSESISNKAAALSTEPPGEFSSSFRTSHRSSASGAKRTTSPSLPTRQKQQRPAAILVHLAQSRKDSSAGAEGSGRSGSGAPRFFRCPAHLYK